MNGVEAQRQGAGQRGSSKHQLGEEGSWQGAGAQRQHALAAVAGAGDGENCGGQQSSGRGRYSAAVADLNTHTFPSWVFVFKPRRVVRRQEQVVALCSVKGLKAVKAREKGGSSLVRSCKRDCDSEGDLGLEAEILEFMRSSENPEMFPSKKQLLDAGRMDLVEGIVKQGGWLAFGWDLDDEDVEEEEVMEEDYRNGVVEERGGSGLKGSAFEATEVRRYGGSSFAVNSSGSASSSGRSL